MFTVPGDDIGTRHLKHPIGNVSTYVALVLAISGFGRQEMVDSFLAMLVKRRIPQALIESNRAALEASEAAVRIRRGDRPRARACRAPPALHRTRVVHRRRQHRPPVEEFLAAQRRFAHLVRRDPVSGLPAVVPEREDDVKGLRTWVEANVERLYGLAELK